MIIAKVWPEPVSSAAGSRLLQLIEFFTEAGWQVSLGSTAKKSEYSFHLEQLHVACYTLQVNDVSFDKLIQELQPDVVLFDRFTTEEQFGWRVSSFCANAIKILDTEDLHCLRAARHNALKEDRVFKTNDLNTITAQREIASIYRCDLSLIISEVEFKLLTDFFKVDEALLLYLPFLIAPTNENKNSPDFNSRTGFITIGNFLHAPNVDSVLHLKKNIWPLIRKQLPEIAVRIYGAYPNPSITQLTDSKTGFFVEGRIEHVEEVMQKARICLAPLRFGAGLKGKLIDAMVNGTPNVCSSIAAEGMKGELDWSGSIKDQPNEFAAAAVQLYSDEGLWKKAQTNGFRIIATNFSKTHFTGVLEKKLNEVMNTLTKKRNQNFIGSMLNYHSLQSSKYMALWIELKNKTKK